MTNVQTITLAITIALISGIGTYAFTTENNPSVLIEKENKQRMKECTNKINYGSGSDEVSKSIVSCGKMELKKIVGGDNETVVSSASGEIEVAPSNKTISLECEWGERTGKVEGIEYHYTATDDTTTLQSIKNSHSSKYGAEHIGYHYVIKPDGEITETRSEKCIAGADKWSKNNYRFIQIAFIGDDKPTAKQTESLLNLTKDIQRRYKLPLDAISAHQEWGPKSAKESLDYWYGSKAEFIKKIREKYTITIYGKESEELTYMWEAWGDKDFIATLFQESRLNNNSVGDSGNSIGYCQIHKGYQPGWYNHYKSLETMQERLNYCHELYTYSTSLKGGVGSRFHGFNSKDEHALNINIY